MEVPGKRPTISKPNTISRCVLCKLSGKTESAGHYCLECEEHLCTQCADAHRNLTDTKTHRVSRVPSLPGQQGAAYDDTMCHKHGGKPFEFYCKLDDILLCSLCLDHEHKQCDIFHIDEVACQFEGDGFYGAVRDSIAEIIRQLVEFQKSATRNIDTAKTVQEDIISDIKHFRTEVNTMLDSDETRLVNEATNDKDTTTKAMEAVSTYSANSIAELNFLGNQTENYRKLSQNRELAIYAIKAKQKTHEIKEKVDEMSNSTKIEHKTFIRNENLIECIGSSSGGIGVLGIVPTKVTTNEQGEGQGQRRSEEVKDTCGVPSPREYNVKYVKDISIKCMQDQGTCHITGIACMDRNRIAVADIDNSSVKVVDIKRAVIIAHIKMASKPRDVTFVFPNKLIVTSAVRYELVFLELGEELSVTKTLKVDGQCRGIHYANGMLYVTFSYPGSVRILSMDGRSSKSIGKESHGRNMFVNPLYVVTNPDTDTIYVSDNKPASVSRLDKVICLQSTHKSRALDDLAGIAMDKDGMVYVAGSMSNNIQVVSANLGELKRDIPVDNPLSLAIDHGTRTLFVSYGHQSTTLKQNYISIYELN